MKEYILHLNTCGYLYMPLQSDSYVPPFTTLSPQSCVGSWAIRCRWRPWGCPVSPSSFQVQIPSPGIYLRMDMTEAKRICTAAGELCNYLVYRSLRVCLDKEKTNLSKRRDERGGGGLCSPSPCGPATRGDISALCPRQSPAPGTSPRSSRV